MKMKRYFAPDMRQAIRKVREDQGPNAVILSNRPVTGGVEIIAALDYDEALVNQALGAHESVARKTGAAAYADTRHDRAPNDTAASENWDFSDYAATRAEASSLENIQKELKALRSFMEAPLLQFGWGEMRNVQPLRANLLKRLMQLGLAPALCRELVEQVVRLGQIDNGWAESLKILAGMVPVADDDIVASGGVIALVGPTGVGKTTTVAKLA
ncbi:MAG TPA: flagellar biosynthesis protein FlhF, partial [Thiolapillus brandeum]|nr:flagellar biosynthesis protein FlhF [Thiolapillus brandeum]